MTRDEWITRFGIELRLHRPEFGIKHAATIGAVWYGAYGWMDPEHAAYRWAGENGAVPPKPASKPPIEHGEDRMGRRNHDGAIETVSEAFRRPVRKRPSPK